MTVESVGLHYMIHGYHVYKNTWIPEVGKVLTTEKDDENIHYLRSYHEIVTIKNLTQEPTKIIQVIFCKQESYEMIGQ